MLPGFQKLPHNSGYDSFNALSSHLINLDSRPSVPKSPHILPPTPLCTSTKTMHAAHPHSRFAVLAFTVAFAALPAAHAAAIPPSKALAAHNLNDPRTTPPHPPRFYNGNADYMSRPSNTFRRRTDGELDSVTEVDSLTDLNDLTYLDSLTDVRTVTGLSKRGDVVSDTDLVSNTSLDSLTQLDSDTKLDSVTKYKLMRRGDPGSLLSRGTLADPNAVSVVPEKRSPTTLDSDTDADSKLQSDSLTDYRSVSDIDSITTLEKRSSMSPNSGARIVMTPTESSTSSSL